MVVEEMHKEAAEVWGKLHVEVGKLRMACSFHRFFRDSTGGALSAPETP